jgi:hypothetical protein
MASIMLSKEQVAYLWRLVEPTIEPVHAIRMFNHDIDGNEFQTKVEIFYKDGSIKTVIL